MKDYSGIPVNEVYTLHDLVHRLTLRTMADGTERNKALMIRAIQDAIRGLPAKHQWNYFTRQARFTSSARLSLSVTYNKNANTLTTTGTWPTDATYGEIVYASRRYRVLNRVSDTVVTMEADFSPLADFTGTATWERRAYQFSREITKVIDMRCTTSNRVVMFLPASTYSSADSAGWYPGVTTHFTIQNNGSSFGSTDIVLIPAPDVAETYEVTACVNPHIPRVELFSGTDGAVTSGSTTFTSSVGGLTDKLIGSIVRVGRTAVAPTYFNGSDWEFQAFVTATTDTTLTLSEPCTVTGTRGFSVSSPVDIEASVMLEHVEDEAFRQYTKNHDHKSFPAARQIAMESWRYAVARDNKVSLSGYTWDIRGWAGEWWYGRFYEETTP